MSGVAGARRSTRDAVTDPAPAGTKGQPAIMQAALLGLCPACAGQTLFRGALRLAPQCRMCGLDFSAANVGDGPVALLMLPLGTLVVAGALMLHFLLGAPWWVQFLVWIPLTTALTMYGLRIIKAWLFAAEYQRGAHEGRRIG